MSETVGDYLLDRLATWGVKRIYGYPGDGINGVMGAFTRSSNGGKRPEFIQVRHEEMAAFMACAHAKFTGEVGVCMATSGPGAIHLLNGLYDAKLDHQPVLAIVGQQARAGLGGKAALPDDLPDVTGSIGLLGTKPSWTLMQDCDTLLMVGSSFPYSEFLPEEGQARGVQIDIDGRMLSIRYPMEVGLVGDSAETLRALIPRLT